MPLCPTAYQNNLLRKTVVKLCKIVSKSPKTTPFSPRFSPFSARFSTNIILVHSDPAARIMQCLLAYIYTARRDLTLVPILLNTILP